MSEADLYRTYAVTIRYLATTVDRSATEDSRRREWSTTAVEISEDDAIWTALRRFRREEIRTWIDWPRGVVSIDVKTGTGR